jgi:isopentenyldiphosphate isomerase
VQKSNGKIDEEIFSVVDIDGNVIGKETRSVCHNGSKILHPVVHVHLINSAKKILLQKRRIDKDIQPGKWDTSIGGHIQFGENIEDAVIREAKEETGVDIDLKKINFIKRYVFESEIEKELSYSYVYYYDGQVHFQESEIEKVNFFDKNEIIELIKDNKTTYNFINEFEILKELKYI